MPVIDCFPDAPLEWQRHVIGEIAQVNPRYRLDKTKEYPFVEMAAVAENFGGITRFDLRRADSSGLAHFKVNDILFGKITPCAENGKIALVRNIPDDIGLGSTEFIVLSPDVEHDPRFIYALVCSNPVWGRAISRMEGSTGRQRITEDTFTKWLKVPLPPPEEQREIARILDAVDAAMDHTRNAIDQAKYLKRGLAQELFSKGVHHTIFKKSELGPIPVSWDVVTVGDVINTAQYGLSKAMHAKGQYPILRMAAIQEGDILLDDLKYVDLPETLAHQYLLKRGDILFNRTNSAEHVGKVGIYRQDLPAVFASYLIRLETNKDLVNNYFLGQLLGAYTAQCRIKRYATPGVQQVNINATNLRRVMIAIPVGERGLHEQERIAEILERQDQSIRDLKQRLEMLNRLKRGLMQDLLTGKVRVKQPQAEAQTRGQMNLPFKTARG